MSNGYDYELEPVEIYEETTWVVHDPWTAQDVGVFPSKKAADLFAKQWMARV